MSYYSILDVAEDADIQDIRKAYKRMAVLHHPDKTGGNDSQFKLVLEAYEHLSDPDKREEYDTKYHLQKNINMQPFTYPEVAIDIDLEDAILGGSRTVELTTFTFTDSKGKEIEPIITRCICHFLQLVNQQACKVCGGSGHVINADLKVAATKRLVKVDIEPGVFTATVERNLIHFNIKQHPLYSVMDKHNLFIRTQISIYQAIAGGVIVLPYFGGRTLAVQHGPQLHEKVYKIPYMGLWSGICTRGDVYVEVSHWMPKFNSRKDEDCFRETYKAFFISAPTGEGVVACTLKPV